MGRDVRGGSQRKEVFVHVWVETVHDDYRVTKWKGNDMTSKIKDLLTKECEFYPHCKMVKGEAVWVEAPDCENCNGTGRVPR